MTDARACWRAIQSLRASAAADPDRRRRWRALFLALLALATIIALTAVGLVLFLVLSTADLLRSL